MIRKERLVKLTQKLIQFNSENPPGHEYALSQFIKKDLESFPLKVKTYSFRPRRPNIVGTLKGVGPRAQKEAILISPHFDTVPAGSGWTFPPYGGKIANGRIYGRGASDDKGNLACCMEVLRSLTEDGIKLKKDVILAATVDEETGSHCGIVPLLEKKILTPGVALIMDSAEFETIVAQKGLIHFRVRISGKKAHGAYNWRGINAIEQAAEVIRRMKAYRFSFKKHALLHPPTVNIGMIKGGDKVNIVADTCEFAVDLRYLPGMNPQYILKEMKALISSVTRKFQITIDDLQYPYEISPEHPFVKAYVESNRRLRVRSELRGSEGATVISFFRKAGIPAIATGFASKDAAHITDEYVQIKDLYKGAMVLEQFLKDYAEVV